MSTISFSIPLEADLLIKKDQDVDFSTPLYTQGKTEVVEINLASKLSTPAKNIFHHLKKFVGETVTKGELIAQTSSFLSSKSYYSELEGVIKEIDHTRGVVTFEMFTSEQNTATSYFKGEVVDIDKNIVKLKVSRSRQFQLASANDSFGGPTLYSQDPEKGSLDEEDVAGRVVVDDNIPVYERAKYDALGAVGFVFYEAFSDHSKAPCAKLTQEEDYKTIVSAALPYCIIDKVANTIYFYE